MHSCIKTKEQTKKKKKNSYVKKSVKKMSQAKAKEYAMI